MDGGGGGGGGGGERTQLMTLSKKKQIKIKKDVAFFVISYFPWTFIDLIKFWTLNLVTFYLNPNLSPITTASSSSEE